MNNIDKIDIIDKIDKIDSFDVTGLELRDGILSASWMHELAASSRQYKIGERRLARHSENSETTLQSSEFMPAGKNSFYSDSKLNKM